MSRQSRPPVHAVERDHAVENSVALVLRPKSTPIDCKSEFSKRVDPIKDGLRINSMRTNKGDLVVTVPSESDSEGLRSNKSLAEVFDINSASNSWPKLRITNVDSSLPQDRVLQGLISQNSLAESLGISVEGKIRIPGRWALVDHQPHPGSWRHTHWFGKHSVTKGVPMLRIGSVKCGNISRCPAVLSVTGTDTSRATVRSEDCAVGAGTVDTPEMNAPREPRCACPVQEEGSNVPTSPPDVSRIGRPSKSHIRRYPKTNRLRILQHNCARNRLVIDELRQLAADQRADILLLQEPYTVAGKVAGLPMVSKLIVAQQGNPWAAIVVLNPSLSPTKLAQFCTSHTVAIE